MNRSRRERTRGAAVNAVWGSGVDPTARLLDEVELPGDAYVGPGAVLQGPLVAGTDLQIQARALVGGPAQHRLEGPGRIVIGDSVRIRECATVHRGSPAGTGVTRLGDRLMLMAYAHVGHDARIGDDVTIANGAQLGGHVRIGSHANIGARAAVHQFVVVGTGAMVAAGAMVSGDVPPWTMVAGDRARVIGPNAVALRERWGREGVDVVRRALRRLWPREGRGDVGVLEDLPDLPPIQDLRSFLTADHRRPVCRRGRS